MPQDEEGLTPAPPVEKDIDLIVKPPGRVGLLQRSHETGRGDLLKNLLTPLTTVDETTKSDIWEHVFGSKDFSDDDLQQYLTPLPIDQTIKADIWDIRQRFTGHLPAAAIPKVAPPDQTFGRAGQPVIPTELPPAPGRGLAIGTLGGRVPTTWPPPGQVPFDVSKSRVDKIAADLGKPKTPPGFTGPMPPPMELVTPLLPEGRSKEMTVAGITGSFNFELEPRTGGTPGTRYAFETPFDPETGQGLRYYFQLEKEYQGGRWEDAWHAFDDLERYKEMLPGDRKRMLDRVWAGDEDIARTIDRAAAGYKTLDQLKEDLAPFNTHRQISVPRPAPPMAQPSAAVAPGLPGSPTVARAGMLPPMPGLEGAVRAEPRIGRTARELLQLQQFGEAGKRWEDNVKAAENYQTLVKQPDKTRREILRTRFASQPEVFEAIDFHAHHRLPFDLLKEDLANLDTVPPADLARPIDPMDLPERPRAADPIETTLARGLRNEFYPDPEQTPEEEIIERQAKIKQQLAPMGLGEWASHALFGEGIIDRMPMSPSQLFGMTTLVIAAQRFNAGVAEDWEIALLDDWDRKEQDAQARGETLTTEVAEVVSWIPGFGAEMGLTLGIYRGGKKVAMEAIRRFALAELPKIARRAARIRGSRFAGAAYGSAGRAVILTPTKGMPRVMEEVLAREDDDFLWAVFKRVPAALADTFIETFSEISGRAIGKGLGAVFGRIPGTAKVRALKTATMMRWMSVNPGKTTADFANVLRKAGWNGVFLEFMEERAAEPPRWLLGLEEMPEGGYFSEERLHQFLVEGLAFSIPGMGHTAIRVFEKGTRGEQQKLYDDIREFSELTRQGLTAEEIWQRSPTMIKDAITKAVDAGEKVEDIIAVQTSVLAPVMPRKDPEAIRPDRSAARPIGADVELRGEVPEPLFMTYPRDYRTQREQMLMASMDIAAGEALEAEDTQRLVDAAAKYEQEFQARTEEFTEKWGALPDDVAYDISNNFPLNPKTEELVYAINSTGVKTTLSGDLYEGTGLEGRQVVYVDLNQEGVDRLDQSALPEGWAVVTALSGGVREWLGLPPQETEGLGGAFDVQDQLDQLEQWRETYDDNRLIREGEGPVSPEDIDAIVAAFRPEAVEPEVLPPDAAGRPEVITPEKAAEDVRRGVEAKKKTQFNTTVMEVNGQFQSQVTDGLADERFTSPIVATEAEARQLSQDWMKSEAERILAAKEAAPAEAAPAAPVRLEPVSPEEAGRSRALDEANAVLADMEAEEEIQYGMDYRDFLFGEGEDPGTRLPLDVSGPIRLQMEEIGTRLGIPKKSLHPEDIFKEALEGLSVENLTGTGFPIEDGLWGVFRTDPSGQKALLSQFADKSKAEVWAEQYGAPRKIPATPADLPDQVGDTGTWKGHRVKIRKLSPKGDRAFLDDLITGKKIRNGVNLQELRQETADADRLRADIESGADMLREPEVPGTEIWRSKPPMIGDPVYDPEQGFGKILDIFNDEDGKPTHVKARFDNGKILDIPMAKVELFRRAAEKAGRPTPGIPDLARREAEARMRELDTYPVGTTFELELEDIPPGIEDKDKWTGSWEKMEDPRDETIFWVNGDSGLVVTSDAFAKTEHASGGTFALRPVRPSPNVVDPPATAPPGKKLSIFAEDERENNPGFLDPVETGQPFAALMMQGRGASLVTIYGANAVQAGVASPVAGAAQYYSFTDHHAKRYGDEVSEHDVKLNNPMVIDNDRQWKDLLEKADAWALYSADTHLDAPEDRPEAARRFQNYLRAQGHDGIIVKVPDIRDLGPYGEGAKRLRETWGETQAVVFYADKLITVSELRDAVMARTDIPEEQVDAWIALLKSHAEGMGMTLQSWVDRTISKVDGKPTIRGKDGNLPPGVSDILYQRRKPLTEAQFMKIWEEMAPALREEKLKTVGEDVVDDAMNDLFAKGWSLRSSFNTAKQVREFFRDESRATQRTYGDKAARFLAPDIEAIGASLLARSQKGPRAFPGWKKLLAEELGPSVDLSGIDLNKLYRRSKVVFERTVRSTVTGRLPSGETLGKLFDKGEANKHWYDKFWVEIQVVFGEDAELFANLVAAHSQMTDTTRNAERGLQAYIELKTGVPFTAVGMARNVIINNLNRAAEGKPIQGIKVTNFLKNLMGDLSAVTLDRHMMGIFFGDKNKAPTERQHQIVATTVTSKARKAGVEPAQYQAALWAAVRNASEERAAPLEKIIFRLLNTDRFAGLKADLIKNAEDPEAVKTLLDAAATENQSKRIPEPEEVIVTMGFGVADSLVWSVADRMETTPSEDVLRRALDRSSTFLDEQHVEDWFEIEAEGPGRFKQHGAAKMEAVQRQKFFKGMKGSPARAVPVGGRVGRGRDATLASALAGEERLLEAIRPGTQGATTRARTIPR